MSKRIFLSLCLGVSLASADTLLLRNGSSINGKFVGGDERVIRFAIGSQVNTYDLTDVDSLKLSGASNYSASSDNSAYPPPVPPPAPSAPMAQVAPPAPYAAPSSPSSSPSAWPRSNSQTPAPSGGVELPPGTQIAVRMIDAADSDRDRMGQTYRASIDQPVVFNGQTVIPRGADAVVVLNDAQQSGKLQGKTSLTLSLRSVTVNGQNYDLASSTVNKASSSRGAKSGEVIGGTAALGAIIGAIAGGGKGAAIGGLSGAGVGTVAQVATSGQHVKVPSETVLTFSLQSPLNF